MRTGNRVPKKFFLTSGVGESDITVHAGSYHLALREAGIEMCNIMKYSSILPGGIQRIERPKRHHFVHGSVMDTISAEATAEYGQTATAGLIWGWLYPEKSDVAVGGLVCEYSGGLPEEQARFHLKEMLNELHTNGYQHYNLRNIETALRNVTPTKMYGTALVALCFTEYEHPVLSVEAHDDEDEF